MIDRAVNAERLLDLIETGEIKYKDEFRIWILKTYEDRNDNLICTGRPGISAGRKNGNASL